MKKIYFVVTNDLNFDQRMQRICHSLATNGYAVTLVGRKLKTSQPLTERSFQQKRLNCFFSKGFLFYAEYNIRLFLFLLRHQMDALCAIDLDTILPCLLVSGFKKITRIYDAHELFTEMKEVRSRQFVHRFWLAVERFVVPKFQIGYTVGNGLAKEFYRRYGVHYEVIRNMPLLKASPIEIEPKDFILYQGAVNEARGLEYLIPAMKHINSQLHICGNGNFMEQTKKLIEQNSVADKVVLHGMIAPEKLSEITKQAFLGINLVEKEGLNQYLSLANKFFDYIHAGVPQISMNYPEYRNINEQFKVAILLDDLTTEGIVAAIETYLSNSLLQQTLRNNCHKAKLTLNWQAEEKKLLQFYKQILE